MLEGRKVRRIQLDRELRLERSGMIVIKNRGPYYYQPLSAPECGGS